MSKDSAFSPCWFGFGGCFLVAAVASVSKSPVVRISFVVVVIITCTSAALEAVQCQVQNAILIKYS